MAKDNAIKLNLPSADDLFSTQESRDDAQREKVLDIPLSEIEDFPDHPFQVKMDESMQAMADSVKAFGIQTPAIVRQKEDGRYELVSGHRRKMACELAGLNTMPCIVRQMSRDEAIIAMVDSNLQREIILPSEKAKSYKMKLEAMKRQGKRTDLTSSPVEMKLKGKQSLEIVGESSGDSKDQVRRYIRLTDLKRIDRTAETLVTDGNIFQTYLDVQSRFDRYSVGNALLIMERNPHAKKLGDVDYWKSQGGFIKRSQFDKPIIILEPGNEYTREDGSVGVSYNTMWIYIRSLKIRLRSGMMWNCRTAYGITVSYHRLLCARWKRAAMKSYRDTDARRLVKRRESNRFPPLFVLWTEIPLLSLWWTAICTESIF